MASKRQTRLRSSSATQKSTSTHHQSMKGTFQEHSTMATSPKSMKTNYPTLTASSAASLARHLASPESDVDSMIREVRSSLTSHGFLGRNNHAILSLRTSRACYLTTKATHSAPSSTPLMSWGMTVNGKCVTARITESPRTGNASSLSDILEDQPDQKYFLSAEQASRIQLHGVKRGKSLAPYEATRVV